jgi:S1-C subfamily serine protease
MKGLFVIVFLFVAVLLPQSPAQADWGKGVPMPYKFGLDLKYQIGPEWGKKVVTPESLKSENPVFQKTAKRTAQFGGFMGSATAFYLGKFNGQHVMATNYHVVTTAEDCSSSRATFTMLNNKIFPCEKFLGSWSDVDYALVTIKVKPEDEKLLEGIGQNMAFHSNIHAGEKLLTIGHGFADNPNQKMVANRDSDCMVYSQKGDIRFMADPDDVNPGDYSVWSFANGCDVSHGDSGSAMVDRDTGDIVGIIWTGRVPKEAKVQDPAYLADIFSHNSDDIWKQLSYAVPSFKIKEVLLKAIENGEVDVDSEETLRQILK